jgi:hypothetical protein
MYLKRMFEYEDLVSSYTVYQYLRFKETLLFQLKKQLMPTNQIICTPQ